MRKVLLTAACIVGVIVGAILIWKFVIPFIGMLLSSFFGFLGGIF